jgi:chorismate mutase
MGGGRSRRPRSAGRTAVRDADREREVLLRVSIANDGPMPQADLLAMYRRLFAATRALESRDRQRERARAREDRGDEPT